MADASGSMFTLAADGWTPAPPLNDAERDAITDVLRMWVRARSLAVPPTDLEFITRPLDPELEDTLVSHPSHASAVREQAVWFRAEAYPKDWMGDVQLVGGDVVRGNGFERGVRGVVSRLVGAGEGEDSFDCLVMEDGVWKVASFFQRPYYVKYIVPWRDMLIERSTLPPGNCFLAGTHPLRITRGEVYALDWASGAVEPAPERKSAFFGPNVPAAVDDGAWRDGLRGVRSALERGDPPPYGDGPCPCRTMSLVGVGRPRWNRRTLGTVGGPGNSHGVLEWGPCEVCGRVWLSMTCLDGESRFHAAYRGLISRSMADRVNLLGATSMLEGLRWFEVHISQTGDRLRGFGPVFPCSRRGGTGPIGPGDAEFDYWNGVAALPNLESPELYGDVTIPGLCHAFSREPLDTAAAMEHLEQAIVRDPGFANAHAMLGLARGLAGAVASATVHAVEALGRDPRCAEAHAILGRALIESVELPPEEALGRLDEALRCSAHCRLARVGRQYARRATGDVEGALSDLDWLVAVEPAPVEALVLRARLLSERGRGMDLSRAVDDALRVAHMRPSRHDIGYLEELCRRASRPEAFDSFSAV